MINWEQHLPSILTLLGLIFTLVVNIVLGLLKNKTDTKAAGSNAESDLREDLLTLVQRYEDQVRNRDSTIEKKDAQIANLQETIGKLIEENTNLRIEKRQLEAHNKELEIELKRFERKVFYVRETTTTIGDEQQ